MILVEVIKTNCNKKAEFELRGSNQGPDDFTLACEQHVGPLLFNGVTTVFPFESADWPLTGINATCCFIEQGTNLLGTSSEEGA